ncbi:MAG: asparagine synthase (glutamine-hydrolyzing) [Candidatus Scalindua sp. AMX11]|nr:MAG: asparagine synthase (glutamine-hydrolyzing) [Candidatus Scalindua sp.]NOG82700.1 asparagine synthase (glutamine-hydrolyzing) [Planctomycetota bacterium]RZV95273.1 MAG: asparagine synthase (glutamine-hydrolyzing) [Candidatus Scalindua sp. SCAELEC01]TDE66247.1 MAG: asparagine synthase (glutamine-hydrolyzing) [Candidatus Scalindua sp. AMX11]GJQ57869.1 MAG: asparagine synthetase B [Candidatus Scalindua sp.]
MCGIVGKFNFQTKEPVSPELLNMMCDTIDYRGPDDSGVYADGYIGLGHRRLSILDLSKLGHQPMSSREKTIWITFNGEIYNYRYLKRNLQAKGYTFLSDCDTEVIIYLYQEYGEGCLEYLRGMFAFAIWDSKRGLLFLARDRIGKKPLFYYHDGKCLLFASELKAIFKDRTLKKEINFEAFYDYFKYQYIPDPKTIYKNAHKLRPGHYLLCTQEGIQIKEYWDISFRNQSNLCEAEMSEELLSILKESVRLRMISDVPLGAFLSGGIDSSGIVALMAKQSNNPVTTCSIGFDSEDYDEVRFARVIANQYGTDHHEFTVKENAEEVLADLAFYFDEPFADSSAVPTYYVSKIARQKVTVALSGDGGDENFAGYEKYYLDDIENRLRNKIPRTLRRTIFPFLASFLSRGNHQIFQKGRTLFNTLSHASDYGFFLTNTEFDDQLWNELINEDTKKQIGEYDPFSVTKYYYNKADTDNHLSKILYTDLKTYLPGDILVKVDRMSMAHSLEVRAPILDHKVIEYAASIPSRLKYNGGEKKYILKKSFQQILPHSIMNRKKMGFSVPLAHWLREELKEYTENHLFSPDASMNNFFQRNAVEKIWNLHQAKTRDYSTILWSLLMFELWYRRFVG